MTVTEVVEAHVRRFNESVRRGDWASFGTGFAEHGSVTFDGVPAPPMVGRAAIVAGYPSAPPDDTITVLSTTVNGEAATVEFAWDAAPGVHAGTMSIAVSGDLITALTVSLTPRPSLTS